MATITPSLIANRLGTVVSNPGAPVNTGPTTGDIGAVGTTPTAAVLRRVFDVTMTSTGSGDTATFSIPEDMRKGIGIDYTIEPQNAAARTFNYFAVQTASTLVITAGAAAVGATFRVCMDSMHSITR